MKESISISGLGIICAIGNDAPQVLESLQEGRSGVAAMQYLQSRHSDLPVGEVKLSNEQMQQMLGIEGSEPQSRTSLMGAIAIRQALQQAGLGDLAGKRVAVISGTTVGGMDVTEKYFQQMKQDDSLLYLPQSNECGKSTVEMAQMAGLEGAECCTISTACSSALNSIILGSEMLMADEADVVLAGGSEALSRFHLNGFNTLMILDHQRCRPFDDTRAGLNLGEGAAFVVLQRTADAAQSLAYVAGYGNRCDAFHQTASSDNGEGAYLAMTDALSMAGLEPCDIQYVNAHGTGTPNNDLSESQALKRVFGENMPMVSSTKAFTGHTTSASGSIETVMCVLAMLNRFVPANLGWEHQIEGGITPTLGAKDVDLRNVVCNSFGFGGNDSSLVISLDAPQITASTAESYECETLADELINSADQLPALKEFISPMESRRMGKLLKAAHLSALRALRTAGIECPDAIISATSRGMLEISQQFLEDIFVNDEELLKPTLFMQSTHNTIGSSIAIRTRCHGYNTTYSQGDQSMEWALRDARRLIENGQASSVLVGCYDESTPVMSSFAQRMGEKVPDDIYARSMVLVRKR